MAKAIQLSYITQVVQHLEISILCIIQQDYFQADSIPHDQDIPNQQDD